ncbi:MAG: hypothetical protein AB8B74_13045 [Crocinitomicaceae bacterium]
MKHLSRVLLTAVGMIAGCYSLIGQTYLIQEDFNNCNVPANWQSETLGSGWNIGTSSALQSPGFLIPDNGTCIAVVNDAATIGNDASNDRLIMPMIDITGINTLVFKYDVFVPVGISFFYIEYSHDSVNWWT